MRKPILLLGSCLLLLTSLVAQEEIFVVELAAFDRTVSNDYWQGLEDVNMAKDHNDIYRYYLGRYHTREAAEKLRTKARDLGYNARIINWEELQQYCFKNCYGAPPIDPRTIKQIFFDFDRSNLRATSREELEKLYILMMQNPGYRIELAGHTDFKGSDQYNEALSRRRAQSAKNYLIAQGVQASRIDTTLFGEKDPIAKNELAGGVDTEQGRQFNRRVEIRIFDGNGKLLNGIVEEIEVPEELKAK